MQSGSQRKQRTARRAAQMQPAALRQARKTNPHPSPLDASPRLVAERQRLDGAFGSAIQRQPDEEELMQGKGLALQRQPEEEEEEPLQGKLAAVQRQVPEEEELQAKAAPSPLQREPKGSAVTTGGLPAGLKGGIESLSGFDMSDVRVHANSSKPAEIGALAYAQGNDIHLGPGQEQHLPHEAWHLVQQRQGRVKPTMQAKGVAINDDPALEREADAMGARALNEANRATQALNRKESGTLEGTLGSPSSMNSPAQRLPANLPRDVTNRIGRLIENLANQCEAHDDTQLQAAFVALIQHLHDPNRPTIANNSRELRRFRRRVRQLGPAGRLVRLALTNLTNYLQQRNLLV